MSNTSSSAVLATLLLFLLAGVTFGETPPKAGKPSAPEPIPGITRMNPYYLGISAAVLANDAKALGNYVKELEKVATSHPDTWMDAMCARLYVLEKLDDRDRFSQAMAELCARKLSDRRSTERRLRFVTTTLLRLRLDHKPEWVGRASDAIWPVLGPEPDPLLVLILKARMEHMPQYAEKAALLKDTLKKASHFLKGTPGDHALQAYWANGMEELYYLSIRNHFTSLKLEPLTAEAAAYLGKFGKDGRHAGEVFYLLLKALNVYYTQLAKAARTLVEAPNNEWLQRWQQTFTSQKGGTWTKQISEEWTKWENGQAARNELVHQPRMNPKLQPRISLKLTRPTIKELLSRLNAVSGLPFTVADNIPEDRVVCGSLFLHEVHAWSLMDQIKQAVVSEGQWQPETAGQLVIGYKLTGNLKPLPPELAETSPADRSSSLHQTHLVLFYLLSPILLLAVWELGA